MLTSSIDKNLPDTVVAVDEMGDLVGRPETGDFI